MYREITERYRLEKILKSTRSGTVLRATDTQSGRTVAIKLIPIENPPGLSAGATQAFERLAGALASLRHPGLPAALDSGFAPDGSAFLVMELLEGRGFETLAGAPVHRLLPLLAQAVGGLESLAGQSLPHFNLSAENLFVTAGPAGEQIKILGFGSALFRRPGPEEAKLRAPEMTQPLPGGRPDSRADLYSLARIACQMIGATVAGTPEEPTVQMPLPLSFELDNAEALRQTLERCLRLHPAERPSHQAIRYAFQLALQGADPSIWHPTLAEPPLPQVTPPAPVTPDEPTLVVPPAEREPPPPETPEEPGEMLSVVDDDVLDALAPPPPPPGTPQAATAVAAPAGRVLPFLGRSKPAVPTATGEMAAQAAAGTLRRSVLLGAAAGLFLLAAAAVLWLLLREPAGGPAAPSPAQAATPAPEKPPAERLEAARFHLLQGEDGQARALLRSLTPADQATLSPADCRTLQYLQETLALATREQLPEDLATGLETGNLSRLRNVVEAIADEPELAGELPPEATAKLAKARQVVDLYSQAEAEETAGRHVEVLQHFAAMRSLIPEVIDPLELRKKAASALEAEAEAQARGGRYPEALATLETVRSTWPDRLGLADRLQSYRQYQRDEQEQVALLAKLPTVERRRKPHEALEMLDDVRPTPHLESRFAEARQRLETQLAKLDQQPPLVVLRDGYYLQYSRGTVANLSFRVTDDYMVRNVKMMARPEGGKMRELPLEESGGFAYTVEITPDLHRNGTVELYVTATDVSGHVGSLGSREKPLQLTRQQGFERIVQ
ncbi:MAG TPA: hypothetical protein VMW27_29635 [Thermoanaerobaculia bacterium]|nr:hypothetical protein [Thermoanaerobaculia bacterium]